MAPVAAPKSPVFTPLEQANRLRLIGIGLNYYTIFVRWRRALHAQTGPDFVQKDISA